MKNTLFITMLTAALLGGDAFANTGYSGDNPTVSEQQLRIIGAYSGEGGNLFIFEEPASPFEYFKEAYGGFANSCDLICYNTLTISGGYVMKAWGGKSNVFNVYENKLIVTGGSVDRVCGGEVEGESSYVDAPRARDNMVLITGGFIKDAIYGGYTGGSDKRVGVYSNCVYITGLAQNCAPDVAGATSGKKIGLTYNNHVHLVGSGASITVGEDTYEGSAMTLGKVIGDIDASKGSSIDIYGSGIQAVSLTDMQILNFHLVDGLATAEVPMVSLSGTGAEQGLNIANFTLGIIADDVTDWGKLAGRAVTLAETQLAITGFGDAPYKVVNVSKTGQSASKGILTLGNEGKALLLKVLRPGTEVLASGDSRQAGRATITALKENEPGLLDHLTLDTDTILGAGRAASLADGLKIQSDANLMIKNMTLTANNEIHVGENTITLNDVTIKISEDYFERENPVDGVYYFKLQDLFHCDVEFNNVVFDASALKLPEGFDPGVNGIGMDFGDDVTIDPQIARNLTLFMDGDWSQTMRLVDGKPVFTALVPTPEPATGTLGLLALAALAARRRRK